MYIDDVVYMFYLFLNIFDYWVLLVIIWMVKSMEVRVILFLDFFVMLIKMGFIIF